MDTILKAAFDPAIGLFIPTSKQLLVPNPASSQSSEFVCVAVAVRLGLYEKITRIEELWNSINHLHFFNFLGKMLGKALHSVRLILWATYH
jgi:hypothetical protein